MRVEKISPSNWMTLAEHAHMGVFAEVREKELDRIDFALLAINEKEEPVGYMTCKELDAVSVYWQYSGVFEKFRGTNESWETASSFLRFHKERYDRCTCYIENKNVKALRTAVKLGFIITGAKVFRNTLLLEHTIEFKGE